MKCILKTTSPLMSLPACGLDGEHLPGEKEGWQTLDGPLCQYLSDLGLPIYNMDQPFREEREEKNGKQYLTEVRRKHKKIVKKNVNVFYWVATGKINFLNCALSNQSYVCCQTKKLTWSFKVWWAVNIVSTHLIYLERSMKDTNLLL